MTNEARIARLESWRELEAPRQAQRELDVEQRLRRLERVSYMGFGAVFVLQLILKFVH